MDKETGLVWERSPTVFNPVNPGILWSAARSQCTGRTTGNRKGWRLPSVHELASLVDPAHSFSALPPGHPFLTVSWVGYYWSASTDAGNPTVAWVVNFSFGTVDSTDKTSLNSVWCARGGMNSDEY